VAASPLKGLGHAEFQRAMPVVDRPTGLLEHAADPKDGKQLVVMGGGSIQVLRADGRMTGKPSDFFRRLFLLRGCCIVHVHLPPMRALPLELDADRRFD
jgi:hypothetical protein